MEALKIEYYQVLVEEKLPNLELTFDVMEENLEAIKVGLQTSLLMHDDISKNGSIYNTALSNNDSSKSSFVKLPDLDKESRKLYEMSLTSPELPKWEMFLVLLQNRAQILENLHGVQGPPLKLMAAVAEWYSYRIVACLVTSSSPVPLKTRRVGQRCTLNLSRAETSSHWCGVVVRRGGCHLRCRPRDLTMVQNYVVRRQKPSCI
ncbi:uncharacterized protein TNCV_1148111 [Trichonephila clavipes]|nr:uncharacterized protein TNCV_1148111 [Trichonephila clavipes]